MYRYSRNTQYHGFTSNSAWPARNSNWVKLKVIKQVDDPTRGLLNGVKILVFSAYL